MTSKGLLLGKVCLVTGATRGIGKGIALQLGEAGATVYITGRTLTRSETDFGSLEDTAREVEERGGRCVAIQCDHSKDEDIKKIFERIKSEQNGRLDLLVNNAYSAVTTIMKYMKVPYWEQPVSMWDDINNVGLRNHYMCSVHAARLMVPQRRGVIVNISSYGGLTYLFNVSYGVGKCACDRMAADCAVELKKHNVAFVSLWPGPVRTEIIVDSMSKSHNLGNIFGNAESPEFSGKAIVQLTADANVMKKTGRVLLAADLADEYGFTDVDGTKCNQRSVSYFLSMKQWWLARFIPSWIKVPFWVLTLYGSKF